jgi:hypothetical protein
MILPMLSVIVIYDILRDGIGATPIVMLVLWLVVPFIVLWMMLRPQRRSRSPSGLGLAIWLVLWLGLAGAGLSNVFYQHFRYRSAAASGNVQIFSGVVSEYHPQDPRKKGDMEILTVAGHTWNYSSTSLGSGGYRGEPSAAKMIRVGSLVRIASCNGRIVKLELL